MPTRVGLNFLSAHSGGGISANLTAMAALERLVPQYQFVVFASSAQQELINKIPQSFEKVIFSFDTRQWLKRLLIDQLVLPIYSSIMGLDFLYCLNTVALLSPCRLILSLENVNPFSRLDLPWSFRQKVRNFILRYLGLVSIKRSAAVRFVSEDSKRLMNRFYGVSLERSLVVPHGWIPWPMLKEPVRNGNSSKPYILYVSNIAPHKNQHGLMQAFDLLVKSGDFQGELVFIGEPICSRYEKFILNLKSRLTSGSRIKLLGRVHFEHIQAFYQGATVTAYPSLEETFGLPILEALSCGARVLVSDCQGARLPHFNPFRELFGDRVSYCDPNNVEDMAAALKRLLNEKKLAASSGKSFDSDFLDQWGRERLTEGFQSLFALADKKCL